MNGGGKSNTGRITEWNAFSGRGLVTGRDGENHTVSAQDISARLLAELRGSAIPPDPPVRVTFYISVTGEAVNVDLA